MILIQNPFPLFTDNDGELLESGYIYIGTAGLNPETNPINVFWDKDLLYPAAQPIRTINGLPSRNGTATPIYAADAFAEYSLTVKDKNQALVTSTSFYPTEVVPADGSVTGPKIDDTAAFIFPTLLSLQKGADITPAAGVLTLGIDGNYFNVTGTDPITSIASVGIGTQAILHFNAALVFTYDVVNLILEGGVSITTEAGGHAYIVEYDTGKWRCVKYVRASGLPVATIDEDDMVSNSDTHVPTQQSVKAYVDSSATSPSFSVNRNGVFQSIPDNTPTKIEFDTEEWDTNNNFDPITNYRFTPTVAGKYLFVLTVYMPGLDIGDTLVLYVYKNGLPNRQINIEPAINTDATSRQLIEIHDANGTTDYFEAYIGHISGHAQSLSGLATSTWFQGNKLS